LKLRQLVGGQCGAQPPILSADILQFDLSRRQSFVDSRYEVIAIAHV
jgi:hypothetical protein